METLASGVWAPGRDKEKAEKKKAAGFQALDAYSEIFPIVSGTLAFVGGGAELSGGNNVRSFILNAIKADSVEILACLADGYNKFYSPDKAKCYSRARTCVCRVQCLLLLASSLGFLGREAAEKLCAGFEGKLNMFNGLIKLFEERR